MGSRAFPSDAHGEIAVSFDRPRHVSIYPPLIHGRRKEPLLSSPFHLRRPFALADMITRRIERSHVLAINVFFLSLTHDQALDPAFQQIGDVVVSLVL